MWSVSFARKKATPERIVLSSRPCSLRRKQWVTSRVQTPLRKTDGSSPWFRSMRSYASWTWSTVVRQSTCVQLSMAKRTHFANRVKRDHCWRASGADSTEWDKWAATQRLEKSRRITECWTWDGQSGRWDQWFRMRCALHEESLLDIQRRRERTRHDPQRLSILRGSQTFKVVVEGSKHTGTQSFDSSRGWASGTGKGTRCVRNPRSRCRNNVGRRWTGPATPSAEERALHEASGHVPYRSWCQWCIAAGAADKSWDGKIQCLNV